MPQNITKKLDELEASVDYLDDLKVWPQDVDAKAKDTDDPYPLPKKPSQAELLAAVRNFRADVKEALDQVRAILDEQNVYLGELEAKFEAFRANHRHQNGPGTWTGKPE